VLACSFVLITLPLPAHAKMGTMRLLGTVAVVVGSAEAVELRFTGRVDYDYCPTPPGESLCGAGQIDALVANLPVRSTARERTDNRAPDQRATYPIVFDEIVAFLESAATERRCLILHVWNPIIAFQGDRISRIDTADLTVIDAPRSGWAEGQEPCQAEANATPEIQLPQTDSPERPARK
jgi:hypothetical protein